MKKNFLFIILPVILFLTGCRNKYQETSWELISPSGNIKIVLELMTEDHPGMLFYSVVYFDEGKEITAVDKSPLGIAHSTSDYTKDLRAVASSLTHTREFDYEMITGKRRTNKTSANAMEIEFVNVENDTLQINALAFDDGIAFSYTFPGLGETIKITGETTGFYIPSGKAWIQPYEKAGKYTPAYEYGYVNEMPTGTPSPSTAGWAFPALFNTSGLWLLISEAGLTEDYCGTHLNPECGNGKYTIRYPSEDESFGAGSVYPEAELPLSTPWRFILVGKTPAPVVESNMTMTLSDPSEIEDVSWIKPGRSSWGWWSNHDSGKDYAALKSFVDLAVSMGWEYSLVDANWDLMEGGTMEQLVEYANSKNIGIILWYNSGGPHNEVTERPRDLMHEPVARNAEMERISKLGVKGIKVDFFQSDKQNIIKLYLDIARDAAKHHILLNTHGCTIPRGWSRTFPHYVSMEGVKGAEAYTFADFEKEALTLNTIYPFTRNVIGPMDYTPVTFTDYDSAHIHLTSDAHELALSIVFESGILHLADRVSGYRNLPPKVTEFLRTVPVTWDDTWFVNGYPGRFVIIGRQKNNEYYIAGITSEENGREANLTSQLDFLPDGTYTARLMTDNAEKKFFDITDFKYAKGDTIRARMGTYGGFVLTLKKQ